MKHLLLTLITLIHLSSFAQLEPNFDYVYSHTDSIKGQIETAKRVKYFLEAKKYDEAIALFSLKQQKAINEFRNDELIFEMWRTAWTVSDSDLKRYIAKIENGKGIFVFEDGAWRIDER